MSIQNPSDDVLNRSMEVVAGNGDSNTSTSMATPNATPMIVLLTRRQSACSRST